MKTLFFGKYVGSDQYGNKYYKSKKNERWVIYNSSIEATKITSEWFLWIHHTTDRVPDIKDIKKYKWQKKTFRKSIWDKNSFKPVKITKSDVKKKI